MRKVWEPRNKEEIIWLSKYVLPDPVWGADEVVMVPCSACGVKMEIQRSMLRDYLDYGIQHKKGDCKKSLLRFLRQK